MMISEILSSFVYSPFRWLHKYRQLSAHWKPPLSLSVDCPSAIVAFHKTPRPFVNCILTHGHRLSQSHCKFVKCLLQFYSKYTIACSSDHIILACWVYTATKVIKQTRLLSWCLLYITELQCHLVAVVEVKELMMTIMYISSWVISFHVVSVLYSPFKTQKFWPPQKTWTTWTVLVEKQHQILVI